MKEIPHIEAGDWKDIDEYVEEVREIGVDIDYENIHVSSVEFVAEVYVEGQLHAIWHGDDAGHMVKKVETSLEEAAGLVIEE